MTGLSIGALLLAAVTGGDKIYDSFIRDDVKPADYEKLTESAKRGRTHLALSASGFFITKDGYILTNHHVVDGAAELVVIRKGTAYRAFVVAKNKKHDLALMKINLFPRGTNGVYEINGLPTVPYLRFADANRLGQTVYAFGFPETQLLGYEPKMTRGIVSGLSGVRDRKDLFQMDLMITHGNSGGPVVDEFGGVVGVACSGLPGISDNIRGFVHNCGSI